MKHSPHDGPFNPMRILVAHNFYRSDAPSGENIAVEAEVEMLRRHGHEVEIFERRSDEIGTSLLRQAKTALGIPWNVSCAADIREILLNFKPDVVHAHNTFPLISPSIFFEASKHAATVLTLHNYRLFCSAGVPIDPTGAICTTCIEQRSVKASLQKGCYRSNRLQNIPVALGIELHRRLRTWEKYVDRFISLVEFQRSLLVRGGLPAEAVSLKPNFFPGSPHSVTWYARADRAVFAGRLASEKGARTLVKAWKLWGAHAPQLLIIGEGPDRLALQNEAAGSNVQFLGQLSQVDTQRYISNSKLLVFPSESFEGFPMTIREAFAFGTPVICSDAAPLSSIVRDGVSGRVFARGNVGALLQILTDEWSDKRLSFLGQGARSEYEANYTEEINHRTLLEIYSQALSSSVKRLAVVPS